MHIRVAALLALLTLAGLATATSAFAQEHEPGDPTEPILTRGDRYLPQPAGTKKSYKFWFGPYVVPPGHDLNRVDLELPLQDGFITAIEPGMRRVIDNTEPSHQEAHIHHAHWFALDPGNQEDNYTGGNTEWIFGNGDEETRADFGERSDAEDRAPLGDGPEDGPAYGQFIGRSAPQLMIYMLHNKTSQPLNVYIALDVDFVHGTPEQVQAATGREYRDLTGVLFGRTYDTLRGDDSDGDGFFEYAEDSGPGIGDGQNPRVVEWTSTVDGVIIGTGGHLHPGGTKVYVENYGSESRPCVDDGRGYGGTQLLLSEALFNNGVKYSEDFQMSVTDPAWRAPVRVGDRIRLSGTYDVAENSWYTVMTHNGFYIDTRQDPDELDPDGDCAPTLIDGSDRDPVQGVPNREWSHISHDTYCGEEYGAEPCEPPFEENTEEGLETNLITIANFLYLPGDRGLSGQLGAPPKIQRGDPLEVLNVDQAAAIRHTITTCEWPCNGQYVANYPWADGDWDSGTMGYDLIDGGNPSPLATLDTSTLESGKYAYFCRIHPWMRGAFEITE